jgi:hypothetical protein
MYIAWLVGLVVGIICAFKLHFFNTLSGLAIVQYGIQVLVSFAVAIFIGKLIEINKGEFEGWQRFVIAVSYLALVIDVVSGAFVR